MAGQHRTSTHHILIVGPTSFKISPHRYQMLANIPQSLKVAVIGSGPAGFYAALRLLKDQPTNIKVDMFEKLPVPFGLLRYGVAPDHPTVKSPQDRFSKFAEDKRFRFYGNISIGSDLTLSQLKDNYNAVILAYGCGSDNALDLPGADIPGVMSARKFVGWYNGLPECQGIDPQLENVENVTIIGNGNVALDVTRVLLASPMNYWVNTDIVDSALEKMRKSAVRNVRIVARRGFADSAFTNKELRDLLELSERGTKFLRIGDEFLNPFRGQPKGVLERNLNRRLKLVEDYQTNFGFQEPWKTWSLDYMKSPVEFLPHPTKPGLAGSTRFQCNTLFKPESSEVSKVKPVPGKFVEFPNELVLTSTGYKGLPLVSSKDAGLPFDDRKGLIPNLGGRVIDDSNLDINNLKQLKGFYTAGWIGHGATGVIATTMMDSFSTVENVFSDAENGNMDVSHKPGHEGIEKILKEKNAVTWKDWLKVDHVEKAAGHKRGIPRVKITDLRKMLEIAK